jgi:hypothetical protein
MGFREQNFCVSILRDPGREKQSNALLSGFLNKLTSLLPFFVIHAVWNDSTFFLERRNMGPKEAYRHLF